MAINFPNSPGIGTVFTDTTSGFSWQWDGTVWRSYSPASSSNIQILDDISGSFNGSTTTFALTSNAVSLTPANSQQLRIVIGGVVQSPGTDYYVSTSNIVFTTAPTAGLSFSGVSLGPAVAVNYANSGNIYARNTYTGAGTTGPFAFSQGYTIGYLDVYRNGVRLRSGTDFVGTSGTNFFLTDAAQTNDELEAIGYSVASLVSATSNLNTLNVTGISTLNSLLVSGISTFGTGNTLVIDGSGNVNTAGVVTATTFNGNVNSTGVSTFTTLKVGTAVTISAGIVSATSFVGSGASLTGITGKAAAMALVFGG